MGRFRVVQGRHFLELAVVVVPLIAILVLQYVSSRRLAEVEVIAHQTTISRYLDAVTQEIRQLYQDRAHAMLSFPGDLLVAKRFDEIARHFGETNTSPARLLFTGTLDGCFCLARYYEPVSATTTVGTDAETEAVVLRIHTLLQASTLPPRKEHRLHVDHDSLYVDETDPRHRAVYRFIPNSDGKLVGFAGFIVDSGRFEQEYLPRAVGDAMRGLVEGVRDNLIVRATDGTGRVVTTTYAGPGQADALATRFDFVFRDWELSARSRHVAAAQVLESSAFTSWVLALLMSIAVLGGLILTWRAVERERHLARIKNAFVANVSHELRTPVTSLAVFGEFLRRGRVESREGVAEYGRRIEHESDRLRHLIENVLDFARMESVETQLCRDEAATEDVVAAAISAVDGRRERGGFTISVSLPDTVLPVVCIDVQAMTQVFVNLLDNAMKYSGRSRRILVSLSQRNADVVVSVTDFGIGIEPDDHERIFQQFLQDGRRAQRDGEWNRTGPGNRASRGAVAWREYCSQQPDRTGGVFLRSGSLLQVPPRVMRLPGSRPQWMVWVSERARKPERIRRAGCRTLRQAMHELGRSLPLEACSSLLTTHRRFPGG